MSNRRSWMVTVAIACLLFTWRMHAAHAAGALITLAGSQHGAVYYVGSDGKRYVFPNANTYATWYPDFSTVTPVSATSLASYPIGGNVTYRAGTRLVKIVSDPRVYAVEPGGVLRPIPSEAVAAAIYGADWNKRIDDVSDAFFFNYSIGAALPNSAYPSGTVVHRSSDGAYFLIDNGSKRKILNAATRAALGIRDEFVLATSSPLAEYPDGADIASAEPGLTDTAQLVAATAIPTVPTLSVVQPPTAYLPAGIDAKFLTVNISSPKPVWLTQITVTLQATTNNPGSTTLDDDLGGLIYGNNVRQNFTRVRFVDGAGAILFGTQELTRDWHFDQSQTLTFNGRFFIPAGTPTKLSLLADGWDGIPIGEGYMATVVVAGTAMQDSNGAAIAFAPSADLVGPTLSIANADLTVLPSALPGIKKYIRGAKGADIAGFSFVAPALTSASITSLTMLGYVDKGSKGVFLPGSNADGGVATTVADIVPQVSLYSSTGQLLAGPIIMASDGRVTFSGFQITIPAGQAINVVVRGDINPHLDLETQPTRLSFDIVSAKNDVVALDRDGIRLVAKGDAPNGGTSPLFYAIIKHNGTMTFEWSGGGGPVVGGRETVMGTLTLKPKEEDFTLTTVSFRALGSHASLGTLRLQYPNADSSLSSVSASMVGSVVVFTGLSVPLIHDQTIQLTLYGSTLSRSAGAPYGETLSLILGTGDVIEFASQISGTKYSIADIGGTDFTVPTNTASSVVLRFSKVTVSLLPGSPTGIIGRDSGALVLKFTAKAEPEGGIRIRKIAFKLVPSDAGTSGPSNDALELWANQEVPFTAGQHIAHLKEISGTDSIVLGESAPARMTYRLFHNGAEVTPAKGVQTQAFDYALLEYDFGDGGEVSVGAGGSPEFDFLLDTTVFAQNNSYTLIALVDPNDFSWTDIPSGAYTPLGYGDSGGIGASSGALTVRP